MSEKSDSDSRIDGAKNLAAGVKQVIAAEKAAEAAATESAKPAKAEEEAFKVTELSPVHSAIDRIEAVRVSDPNFKSERGKKAFEKLTKAVSKSNGLTADQQEAVRGVIDKMGSIEDKSTPTWLKKCVVAICKVVGKPEHFKDKIGKWEKDIIANNLKSTLENKNIEVGRKAMKLRSALVSKKAQSSPQPQPLTSSIRVGLTTAVGARIGR